MVQWTSELPNRPDIVQDRVEAFKQATPSYDDIVEMTMPIARRFYTIDGLQQLNRLFSTPSMRQMVEVQPQVMKELVSLEMKMLRDIQTKLMNSGVQ